MDHLFIFNLWSQARLAATHLSEKQGVICTLASWQDHTVWASCNTEPWQCSKLSIYGNRLYFLQTEMSQIKLGHSAIYVDTDLSSLVRHSHAINVLMIDVCQMLSNKLIEWFALNNWLIDGLIDVGCGLCQARLTARSDPQSSLWSDVWQMFGTQRGWMWRGMWQYVCNGGSSQRFCDWWKDKGGRSCTSSCSMSNVTLFLPQLCLGKFFPLSA